MERDSINWAKGERSFIKEVLLKGRKVGTRNHEKVFQAFSQLVLPGIEPVPSLPRHR